MLNNLGFFVGVIGILIGIGVAVPSNHPKTAKVCFTGSALILWGWFLSWLNNGTELPLNWRLAVYVLSIVCLGFVLFIAWKFVNFHSPPKPNLQCLGEEDLFLQLANNDVFSFDEHFNHYRAAAVAFQNLPRPPVKTAHIDNVQAEITFYNWDFREHANGKDFTIERGMWVGERTHQISFPVGTKTHYLVCACLEPRGDHENGYKDQFTFFGHSEAAHAPLEKTVWRSTHQRFFVQVRLIAGANGEYGGVYDFDLEMSNSSYTFVYLSDKVRKERKDSTIEGLQSRLEAGRKLLADSSIIGSEIYSDVNDWRWEVEGFIRKNVGINVPVVGSPADWKHEHWWIEEIHKHIGQLEGALTYTQSL